MPCTPLGIEPETLDLRDQRSTVKPLGGVNYNGFLAWAYRWFHHIPQFRSRNKADFVH